MFPPPLEPKVAGVLSLFDLPANLNCERVKGNGLSGAKVWKISAADRSWCLKRYSAEHPTAERLAAIHGAILAAAKQVDFLAPPIADRFGATAISIFDHLWDISPWLPGAASDFPSAPQIQEACSSLAALHLAWRNHPWNNLTAHVEGRESLGPSPGLQSRLRFLNNLTQNGLAEIESQLPEFRNRPWYGYAPVITKMFRQGASTMAARFQSAAGEIVPRQVCLRDARPEHFLFNADQLCGIIDYDAVRVDSPMIDLARLCGDWGQVSPVKACDDYASIRPVTGAERRVFNAAVLSAKFLTGMQWLHWLVVERRVFDDEAAIAERLRDMLMQ